MRLNQSFSARIRDSVPFQPRCLGRLPQGGAGRERRDGPDSYFTQAPGDSHFPLDLGREGDPPVRDLPFGETALRVLRELQESVARINRCTPQRDFREPLPAEPLCASSRPPTRDLRLENPQPPHLKNSRSAHPLLSRNSRCVSKGPTWHSGELTCCSGTPSGCCAYAPLTH